MVLMLGEYNIDCILENKLKQIMENWNISTFEIDWFTLESDISEIYFPFEHESMFLFLFFIP